MLIGFIAKGGFIYTGCRVDGLLFSALLFVLQKLLGKMNEVIQMVRNNIFDNG